MQGRHLICNTRRGMKFLSVKMRYHENSFGVLAKCCETPTWSMSWWRHQMETFSALLAPWAGNSPVAGEFPAPKPVTRSFDVYFDLHLNKRLCKQSIRHLFEMPSCSLWRQCNGWYRLRPVGSNSIYDDISSAKPKERCQKKIWRNLEMIWVCPLSNFK